MRRVLCIYLPNWPIQWLLAGRDVRDSVPIVLHARDPRRGEMVVACNAAASQRGVRLGMPLAEAATLCRVQHLLAGQRHPTPPHPSILPHDPAADLAALARLAEHCERFSPIVGWETVEGQDSKFKVQGPKSSDPRSPSPDFLLLDVTGIGVLFGGEESLAREVVADLARLGYDARVAVADTVGAAWGLARNAECGVRNAESGKSEVNAASTSDLGPIFTPHSPFRTPHYAPRTPHSALRTLPLSALRLPGETLDLLAQLGVTQLDQLLALPRQSLRSRFGERLLLRLDQFLGTAAETIVAHRPPPEFLDQRVLDFPVERREAVESIVRELVEQVARSLAERREGAVQLDCRLDCAPGRPLQLQVGLFRPSAEAEHLWDLMRMQLEQTPLPGPVGRATLAASLTAPLENRQGELFAGSQRDDQRHLALLIDRCRSRLGDDAVICPERTSDPLPERAVAWESGVGSRESARVQGSGFGVQKRRRKGKRTAEQGLGAEYSVRSTKAQHLHPTPDARSPTSVPHSTLVRPLTLLSPPIAIQASSVVPDGPPLSFRQAGQTHKVARWWGPERIETGWWRGASVRRDYYRVETITGCRFWLFRSLRDGQWHLHGRYD